MHRRHIGAVAVVGCAALALVGGCSASKKTSGAAAAAASGGGPPAAALSAASAAATGSATVRVAYLAAIAPVDKLRDEYEASKGTSARATIAPTFAASLRTFDVLAAKLPTSGRTETDVQTMISYDQLVATEVTANDLTTANVNRDDAAHAVVRSDLGLPPA